MNSLEEISQSDLLLIDGGAWNDSLGIIGSAITIGVGGAALAASFPVLAGISIGVAGAGIAYGAASWVAGKM